MVQDFLTAPGTCAASQQRGLFLLLRTALAAVCQVWYNNTTSIPLLRQPADTRYLVGTGTKLEEYEIGGAT